MLSYELRDYGSTVEQIWKHEEGGGISGKAEHGRVSLRSSSRTEVVGMTLNTSPAVKKKKDKSTIHACHTRSEVKCEK